MRVICPLCKEPFSLNCKRKDCPVMAKARSMLITRKNLESENYFGSSPAPFVGRFDYPNISVGILSPPEQREDSWLLDAPGHWAKNNFGIDKIIGFRSSLINSNFKTHVKNRTKFLDISQEVGMASKPVDVEINLEKKPTFHFTTQPNITPIGPTARLKKAEITSNPKISKKVDYVVSDTDLKANQGLIYLYERGFDENFLSKLLSVANLGTETNRKLVPTRWSITATDDALGKHLIDEIKNYDETDCIAYFGGFLGNYYFIMLFPDVWSYELFEIDASTFSPAKKNWWTDYEGYAGRKNYASVTVGGYYAARLPILNKLKKLRRQASILALRFVTSEYYAPLGVWVVREATRKAMMSKPIKFGDKDAMLKYAKEFIHHKFNINTDIIFGDSKLLDNIKIQTKLSAFFRR